MNRRFLLRTMAVFAIAVLFLFPLAARDGEEPGGVLRFNQKEQFSPNGSYNVSVLQGDRWTPVGEILSDKHFRKGSVDLTQWIGSQESFVRIEQLGGGAAQLDSITLGGIVPSDLEGDLAVKLLKRDYDVIDAYGKTLEFRFAGVPADGETPVVLELAGRIEPDIIGTTPFHFPLENMYKEITGEPG